MSTTITRMGAGPDAAPAASSSVYNAQDCVTGFYGEQEGPWSNNDHQHSS